MSLVPSLIQTDVLSTSIEFTVSTCDCELNLGCHVTGHNSVLHACTVEDEAFVGMGSTILDGAVVEKGAMVAAGSVVTQKTRIPTGQVSVLP